MLGATSAGQAGARDGGREKQQEYLTDEGAVLGFEFTPDIKLVFQTFHVVYK